MIIVKLQGGLGNQMFQYAMGRALSLRTGEKVHYDRSWYEQIPSGDTPRPFELDIFSLPLVFAKERQIPLESRPVKDNWDVLRRKIIRRAPSLRALLGMPRSRILVDDGKGICQDVFKILHGQNVYLNGYWQSEKYFKDAASIIRKDFIVHEAPDNQNKVFLEQMAVDSAAGICSVSIHIRRGDYSSNPQTNVFHGLLPLDYYRSAMSVIEGRFPKVSYYVFSDDLSWCRENLKFKDQVAFVDINADKTAWMDMRLMSACQHHIIANSSFSWWGAWLSGNRNKIVIAPKKWVNMPEVDARDIIPSGWVTI